MKRIRLMAAKLLQKENADPAESLLPYTNKRPSRDAKLKIVTKIWKIKIFMSSSINSAYYTAGLKFT